MKMRIKFSKEGSMKFVGHLDTMRYFQKAIRRAGLPVAYSGGFSPHMILSFAAPLGVGTESRGEYFDMELTESLPSREIVERLNRQMVEGVRILGARQVEEGKAGKAMSLVAAADYQVEFREGKNPGGSWQERIPEFLSRETIPVNKKTKRSEKTVDIRPFIYRMEAEEERIFLRLASASANYTKPELVMDTFLAWMGEEPAPYAYRITRLEVYADTKEEGHHNFVPLMELGEEVL
ncbi:MAG: TIGR03936 family radical SAM-associated protein [Clostridiales bacterium]|nr:TIGR03936 family radical SAM-associated protein [Clostridiales bacterium]